MFKILFSPKRAQRHPLEMMLIGIFYSSISLLLSAWIFPEYSSLVMVFLTVFPCIYVIQGAINIEEKRNRNFVSEKKILKKHARLIVLLLFLFLGFVISFTFWSIVLPNEMVLDLFKLQDSVVEGIKQNIVTGNTVSTGSLFKIISNNFKVLILSLVLAFFYGAGAIFILVWNASVMGFVIGNLTKETLGLVGLPVAFTKYFVHGIPEMLSYLVAALAGGIIYTAIWRGDIFDKLKNKKIIIDVLILIAISIVILIGAAFIEVYISPVI
ncbi:stage II sporulation protein M [Candidatus Pacearchaeota archaeon]|nr:stage II sporulation protein M [Candidatus Pacearchaeota archaeon]